MDVETSEVIERINARIDALEITLRNEIRGESAAARDDLRGEMSSTRDDLRGEMASMGDTLRGEMSTTRDDLRGEMSTIRDDLRDSFAESKHHAIVLNESVRDDIRILAEGFAAMSAKLDTR